MDSVFLTPKLRSSSSSFTFIIPHNNNNHSLIIKPLIPTNFNRIKTPLISSSHSSNPNNSSNHNHTINPTFWDIIKRFTISLSQKWVSISKPHCEDEHELKNCCYLQNGGLGLALLTVTTNAAKLRISPFVATLAANPTFVSGLFAWIVAQSVKVFLNFYVERKWDLRLLFASGGMPSSHSALCTALTTSVAICHGVADSLFPVCLGFSLIVMYDAIGVRRHAGMQAEVLNMIVADLFQGHPMGEKKLKEFLGHTPSQVLAGALLGFLVAFFCCGS